jgi:predicted phosphodiesterase
MRLIYPLGMNAIAVLSDIHGNRWALEAVLEDMDRRGATFLLNLGDTAYGPLDPAGTVARLMDLPLPARHILGNGDRLVLQGEDVGGPTRTELQTYDALNVAQAAWLGSQPSEAVVGSMRLVHGSPGDDTRYLLETSTERGLRPVTLEHLSLALRDVREDIILCGHSHVPRHVQLPGGKEILNPGSVGLQAFTDDHPFPHVVQNFSPHARYALLEPDDQGWIVSLVSVPYDWESAARKAEENRRPDWARALRSGWI